MVLQCRSCGKTFGMLRSKYHCAFCSLALCSGCLNKDVILFTGEGSSAVHIAVIKVVGVCMLSDFLWNFTWKIQVKIEDTYQKRSLSECQCNF